MIGGYLSHMFKSRQKKKTINAARNRLNVAENTSIEGESDPPTHFTVSPSKKKVE